MTLLDLIENVKHESMFKDLTVNVDTLSEDVEEIALVPLSFNVVKIREKLEVSQLNT